ASPLGRAASSALGSVLVLSAIAFAAMRAFFDVAQLVNGAEVGKPGLFGVGMVFGLMIFPPLAIGGGFFICNVCVARCEWPRHGWLSALAAILLILGVFVIPPARIALALLPPLVLGAVMKSSLGWYLGSALQFGAGAWLLGWTER